MKFILKHLLSITFLLIAFHLSAQTNDSTKTSSKRSHFSIGIVASPQYCYRVLSTGSGANSYTPYLIDSRNDREIPKFGYSAGVNVIYEISKNISLESGINYSDQGYQFDLNGLTFGDMIDPRYGFVYETQEIDEYKSWTYHYTYLDIPLKIAYTFPGKKIQFTASGGFIANILLDAYETVGSTKINRDDDFTDFGISASVAAGVLYNFNDKFRMSVMPVFQYSLTNLRSSPVNEHLFSAGINVGGFYRL